MSAKVSPEGRVPVSVRLGAGKPVVVTEKDPEVPLKKLAELAEVIAGAWSTVMVKVSMAGLPTPLVAVRASE